MKKKAEFGIRIKKADDEEFHMILKNIKSENLAAIISSFLSNGYYVHVFDYQEVQP